MLLDFPKWKVWLTILTIVIGVGLALPSLLPESVTRNLPAGIQNTRINLGLDLKGGSHLLLEADTGQVAKARLQSMEESIRTAMRRAEPRIEIGDISTQGGELSFYVRDVTRLDAAVELARNQTIGVGVTGQRDWNVAVRDGTRIVMTPTAAGQAAAIETAMDAARRVVGRRVDPTGTREVAVQREGPNRIAVDVPGLDDPEGLKALLGKTAKLEFKLVDLTANGPALRNGTPLIGSEILPILEAPTDNFGQPLPHIGYPTKPGEQALIAVQRRVMVSGDQVNRATQGFDQQTNAPIVELGFNTAGGTRFARVTQENVGKPFAIILDDVVISAPTINEAIMGGQARISGNFTVEAANELAVQLSSGRLPVALKVVEESSVSPELGRDSIRNGVIAGIVASLALIIYMLVTYFRFGVYTTLALLLNGLLVLGGMALFNATLTLPGIAGFVLTIGAAVDANVLINERIREEIRRGRNTLSSVEFGYKEASTAIFDANITNVISALILFWFGSGPIKGFAAVLAIGIATSVFTGVTFTRLLVADYLKRNRPKELVL